eukprot:186020-Pelagomonas_calceolata.AAC.2
MLTIGKFKILVKAYEAAKKAGTHATIQPPVQDTATEIMGLLSCQMAQEMQLSAKSKKAHNSNALITPPHNRSALRKWYMVSMERFSNPLEFDCNPNTYFSTSHNDKVFGACIDASLCATVATPSAILLTMVNFCSNS